MPIKWLNFRGPLGNGGDPDFSSVVLLLHFDGTNGSTTFTDSSGRGQTLLPVDDTQLDTSWKLFGTASGRFPGANDSLQVKSNPVDFTFGTGDFTAEFTVRFTNVVPNCVLLDQRNGPLADTFGVMLNSANKFCPITNGSEFGVGTTVAVAGTPYRIAVSRVAGTTRLFVNGVLESTSADTRNYVVGDAATPLKIAQNGFNNTSNFDGNIDELRVTKGIGRYTATYLLPDAAFPDN